MRRVIGVAGVVTAACALGLATPDGASAVRLARVGGFTAPTFVTAPRSATPGTIFVVERSDGSSASTRAPASRSPTSPDASPAATASAGSLLWRSTPAGARIAGSTSSTRTTAGTSSSLATGPTRRAHASSARRFTACWLSATAPTRTTTGVRSPSARTEGFMWARATGAGAATRSRPRRNSPVASARSCGSILRPGQWQLLARGCRTGGAGGGRFPQGVPAQPCASVERRLGRLRGPGQRHTERLRRRGAEQHGDFGPPLHGLRTHGRKLLDHRWVRLPRTESLVPRLVRLRRLLHGQNLAHPAPV